MSSPPADELTRKQRREQARAERKAAEEAERARHTRRKRMNQIGGAVVALIVVAVVVIVAASSGGGGGSTKATKTAPTTAGSLPGLQISNAPWAPEYNSLAQRLQLMNLPTESDAAYHVHAHVSVYVNGKNITVPASIGIDPQGQFLAPLHTHDASGVIHMESSQTYPFTLGQFFDVWGVKFTNSQLGAYQPASGAVLTTYVNGKPITNAPSYVIKPHDLIIVGYGKPGSFPTSAPYSFAAGL